MGSRRRVAASLAALLSSAALLGATSASAGLLDGLSRPHPKFISGTAEGSTYDAKGHVYTATYSTERSDNSGRYPVNSVSGYEVPKAAYPHGYAVVVKGGFVISGTDDELLLIASGRNAKTIRLIIKPASDV
jgi:hypothetical protein